MRDDKDRPLITVSIVSHRQASLVSALISDFEQNCKTPIELIVTLNVAEENAPDFSGCRFPVRIIRNPHPKGFGANHNSAFLASQGDYFCVLNPDIRFSDDPFPVLLDCLKADQNGGRIVAPLVVNGEDGIEDSARRFPTPFRILTRVLKRRHTPDYVITGGYIQPDWVAGMFMLIPRALFRDLRGFDERYFLYYEDVDLCARARLSGHSITLCPQVRVTHAARRQSHREFRYLRLHLSSMCRFFLSKVFFRILWRKVASV